MPFVTKHREEEVKEALPEQCYMFTCMSET